MNKRLVLFLLVSISITILNASFSYSQNLDVFQKQVDNHFKAERYLRAFEGYSELAKTNDKYAQYKLAYMYSEGLATEVDTKEAFAWAVVAAEGRQSQYVDFYKQIKKTIKKNELNRYYEHADVYLKNYGNLAMLLHIKALLSKKKLCRQSESLEDCEYYNPDFQNSINKIFPVNVSFDEGKVDEYIVFYSKPFYEYSDLDKPN